MEKAWMGVGVMLMTMVGAGCTSPEPAETGPPVGTFGGDVDFLRRYVEVVTLRDAADKAQVALVPAWQGRVMTSTNGGVEGTSFGWVNYALIRSGTLQPHINVFGGEDRLWLGPEGGQFSLFFRGGDPFDLEHWQTPAAIDSEPFELVSHSASEARFRRETEFVNYSGTRFHTQLDRTIRLLDRDEIIARLGVELDAGIGSVAFESENQLTNAGQLPWNHDSGLLSLWILGMYVPTPETTVVVPYRAGSESELGPVVKDDYFGRVPPDRLQVRDGLLLFRADGQSRGKIGVSPRRARPLLGSWDGGRNILTIVQFNLPDGVTDYVNSAWELQQEPFAGDTVNSYNDGPPEPGAKPLGPFYELETSSPAAALAPGESLVHIHRTFHFTGEKAELDRLARALLGISVDEIAF